MNEVKVSSWKKLSVILPYLVGVLSLLAFMGQQLMAVNLIPLEYQFIVTSILVPLAAHAGRLIKQPYLADSPYNPANQREMQDAS